MRLYGFITLYSSNGITKQQMRLRKKRTKQFEINKPRTFHGSRSFPFLLKWSEVFQRGYQSNFEQRIYIYWSYVW